MQLTEEELFEVLKQRYFLRIHGGNGESSVENTRCFADALKAFVEKFTNNKNTISAFPAEKVVSVSSTGNLTIHCSNVKIEGETK